MLLRNRPPGIESGGVRLTSGFEHLEVKSVAVLRWLNANKIDYVVVGPVGHAIRGDVHAKGAVAIVPAPYRRNWDRLARALIAEHAGLRTERGLPGTSGRIEAVTVKLTGEKLARGRRWMLRFGGYDLDIERSASRTGGEAEATAAPGAAERRAAEAGARYQELLYEANRFGVADGVSVEVAAPEDLEHYSHVRRTGTAPEFRVTRNPPAVPVEPAEAVAEGEPAGSAEPTGAGEPTRAGEPTVADRTAPAEHGDPESSDRRADISPDA